MLVVFATIAPIFLIVVAGFCLRRTKLFPAEAWPPVERITYLRVVSVAAVRQPGDSQHEQPAHRRDGGRGDWHPGDHGDPVASGAPAPWPVRPARSPYTT
ncbi:MAG: hypothetical protein CBC23_011340 [Rhodospirillaceae bacterium TMED63]|nr:MAG: hypothetical protein CBC23_011340 [Rhodospirillaceae bacterium TMED63]